MNAYEGRKEIKIMVNIFYDGLVSMKPYMEKKDFCCSPNDYGLSYQLPKVCFECSGEVYEPTSAFTWSDDSVIVVKDKCILKYTESNFSEVLVTDVNDKKHWLENRVADFWGFSDEDVEDSVNRKRYTIEEYDLDKSERRIYEVTLKETVGLDYTNKHFIENVLNKAKELDNTDHLLVEQL